MLNRDKSLKELAKLAVKRGLESIGNITQKMNTLKNAVHFKYGGLLVKNANRFSTNR